MLTVTRSKARSPYMRYMVSRSGNSLKHGPHQVAQKFTSTSFPVWFLRNAFKSSALAGWILTGELSVSVSSCLRPSSLYIHVVEHPPEGVFAAGSGLFARR